MGPLESVADTLIPANTWTLTGEGIVTPFDHPVGGQVTVFEFLQDGEDGERIPMVAFHCDPATPTRIDHESTRRNRGPQDRRWTARVARTHIHRHAEQCRPVDPCCATIGPCAQIRHLSARA